MKRDDFESKGIYKLEKDEKVSGHFKKSLYSCLF